MAKVLMPPVSIAGDEGRIMARTGELVGFSKHRALWRFGFLANSEHALAFDISTDAFTWILVNHEGKPLAEARGSWFEIPERFKKVVDAKI